MAEEDIMVELVENGVIDLDLTTIEQCCPMDNEWTMAMDNWIMDNDFRQPMVKGVLSILLTSLL